MLHNPSSRSISEVLHLQLYICTKDVTSINFISDKSKPFSSAVNIYLAIDF